MHLSRRRSAVCLALACAVTAALSGCGSQASPGTPGSAPILTAFYPLQYVAERVSGSTAVRSLTPPGAEPHDLELSPAAVAQVGQASLVVYIAGFQPAIDQALAAHPDTPTVNAAALVDLIALTADQASQAEAAPEVCAVPTGDEPTSCADPADPEASAYDPHIWLDPTRLATIADAVAEQLSALDPDQAATYRANAQSLRTDLEALDQEFATGLATCQSRHLVATHAAFGYLAERYDLTQLSVVGIDPDAEPSPARLRQVAGSLAPEVTTIFFESQASPQVADALAGQAGLTARQLDPLETSDDATYLERMRANLATLSEALRCS
jgi:zinc transport system substrate-binding protein